jgi:hypothetical protein
MAKHKMVATEPGELGDWLAGMATAAGRTPVGRSKASGGKRVGNTLPKPPSGLKTNARGLKRQAAKTQPRRPKPGNRGVK